MPIYEYVCESCQDRFEVQQRMSDPPLAACVKCGAAVKRVISASAIMFKGSGWYVTDYSEKMKPPAGAESDVKPAGDAKPASEAKPAGATTEHAAASTTVTTPATTSSGGGAASSTPSAPSSTPDSGSSSS